MLYIKAFLFLITGTLSSAMIVGGRPSVEVILLLLITVWSFCRLYYFAFYVVEKYVDPSYRFSGLMSFVAYLVSKIRSDDTSRG
jgi:hypothetical protein